MLRLNKLDKNDEIPKNSCYFVKTIKIVYYRLNRSTIDETYGCLAIH